MRAPLITSTVSRLLVDLNRSIGHPQLFSVMTRDAPIAVRDEIVKWHYNPYRLRVEECVNRSVSQRQRVIHISAHSFTPALDGKIRHADVGLLYDPERRSEAALCTTWKLSLADCAPALVVRRNYPYEGKDDGLPSYLRTRFADDAYLGIELEINQSIVTAGGQPWKSLRRVLIDSLRLALDRLL